MHNCSTNDVVDVILIVILLHSSRHNRRFMSQLGERGILREARNECEMPCSPCLAHKALVMQASSTEVGLFLFKKTDQQDKFQRIDKYNLSEDVSETTCN